LRCWIVLLANAFGFPLALLALLAGTFSVLLALFTRAFGVLLLLLALLAGAFSVLLALFTDALGILLALLALLAGAFRLVANTLLLAFGRLLPRFDGLLGGGQRRGLLGLSRWRGSLLPRFGRRPRRITGQRLRRRR
jgi:hypothetical protein